jgi:bifunctional ADP-heptose synthase (sugar kinase/adenylyltransferase)
MLTVGVNCDEYIRSRKGREPLPLIARMEAVRQFGVHDVVCFREDDPSAFIEMVRPNVHCIGMEYRYSAPEIPACQRLGIKVVWVPRVGKWSSTLLRL